MLWNQQTKVYVPNPGLRRELITAGAEWRTVPSFLPSYVQDPEHTNVEHKCEQAGTECWAPQDKPTEAGITSEPKAGFKPPSV